MPTTDAGVDQAVAKDSADAAAQAQAAVGASIPEADEPLKVSVVTSLAEILAPALDKLTNGEIQLQFQPVQADVPQLPADLGAPIIAVAEMVKKYAPNMPALKGYIFDAPELMRTNAGLTEIATTVDEMSRDEAVLAALKGPPPGQEGEPDGDEEPAMDAE